MRTHPLLRPLLSLVALLTSAALVLVATPAQAATWHFDDPRDGGNGDIRHATVVAGAHGVHLRIAFQRYVAYFTAWEFDVDPSTRSPEFGADVVAGYPEVYVKSPGASHERCVPHTAHVSHNGRVLTASFPLRCLRYHGALPTQLRVRIYTGEEEETDDDCAPGGVPPCTRWSHPFAVG